MSKPVQPSTPGAEIVAEEERLHGRVQARVAMGQEDIVDRVGTDEFDEELIRLRDMIAEAKPEDLPPLVEQMTRLAAIRSRLGGSRSLPADPASPYFAHMVLSENGRRRDVLVGKRGFIDRKHNVQIVDWRNAPVSRIYYRYDEGDDYEEEIAGRPTQGMVEVRRNVSIIHSKLRRIGAPQGTFVRDSHEVWHEAVGEAMPVLRGGQGKAVRVPRALKPESRDAQDDKGGRGKGKGRGKGGRGQPRAAQRATLGVHGDDLHRADKSLPEIAALIDGEQFDLITQPESGMVVIQGGAGSGKTTVALHRIAYLNFADRSRFRPQNILFVVPSASLARYVAGVLPALGVSGVAALTYERWARDLRIRLLRGSSGKYNHDTPEAVSRVKKHPALLGVLDRYVAAQAASFGDEILAAAREAGDRRAAEILQQAWAERAELPLAVRLAKLGGWLRSRDARLPSPVRQAAESAVKRLRRRAGDVLADWSELMSDPRALGEGFAGWDDLSAADLRRTVEWCAQQAAGPVELAVNPDGQPIDAIDGRAIEEDGPGGRFDLEDDPILLRLIQLKRGRLLGAGGAEVSYEHVAIDEAQDRSAIEVKVLIEATRAHEDSRGRPQRSITIAGDTAQRLVFDNSFHGWQSLLDNTGQAAVVRPLRLSYRSTAEVMYFAREVLGPELAPDEPLVARSGEPVELHMFGDIGEAVAFLADALRALVGREPSASVAVLARHSEQADAYYAGLMRAEVPSLRRVRNHDFRFVPGVDVTDVTQVKGLEFDYVIMVDVNASSYPSNVESRHLLHIGATRAAHQLWLISTSTPSNLLPEELRERGSLGAPPPADADDNDGGGTGDEADAETAASS
ncbi:ATP-binding domain-containing protein [Haliangium ochraceum]|uniref:DNA 3'-5' helicase II n=1 Tax=Haliangium ochraceum (strain DSM 14365 / JCM 11303 / SMP-2) TaxID=502025 RepID=D0LFN3_HALO1|nr:3'-5' exonuclease [Haliangium ochraceum]ACY12667.1 UvrD/Rep helicase family protein [Haliangium ochraceum DSM 14365]